MHAGNKRSSPDTKGSINPSKRHSPSSEPVKLSEPSKSPVEPAEPFDPVNYNYYVEVDGEKVLDMYKDPNAKPLHWSLGKGYPKKVTQEEVDELKKKGVVFCLRYNAAEEDERMKDEVVAACIAAISSGQLTMEYFAERMPSDAWAEVEPRITAGLKA